MLSKLLFFLFLYILLPFLSALSGLALGVAYGHFFLPPLQTTTGPGPSGDGN